MTGFELTAEEMKLFLQEGYEQLELMEQGLLSIEADPDDPQVIQAIFRAAHTLKGGAGTAGFHDMERLTHVMESLLDQVRSGERVVTPDLIDHLLDAVDVLRESLAAIEAEGTPESVDVTELCNRLHGLLGEAGQSETAAAAGEAETDLSAGGAGTSVDESPSGAAQTNGSETRRVSVEERGAADGTAQSAQSDERVFLWEIQVAEESPMPAVRLYQALMILEEAGRIIEVEPTAETLEQGEGEHSSLRAVVAMAADPATVQDALRGISDVETVSLSRIEAVVGAAAEGAPAPRQEGGGERESEGARDSDGDEASGTGTGRQASSLAQTVRVDVALLDRLLNLVGELVIDRTRVERLASLDASVQELHEELQQVSSHLGRITNDLQDNIMRARMMPIDTLFRKFPRLVRDVSRLLNKKVRLEMTGGDTELDRSVIEQIGDPLMHLLRNAVDHGIEVPEERVAAGKPSEGRVTLRAFHQENHIFIEVQDDGRGINPEFIRDKALAKGIVTEEEVQKLSREELIELVLEPGFSTAEHVSEISGRGVGLDVVRKNIERVSGHLTVQSEVGKGTTWRIKLPLTLAIVQALLVDIAGGVYAIPIANVVEAFRVAPTDVEVAHGWRMLRVRDNVVPLLDPGDVWGDEYGVAWHKGAQVPVVVLQAGFSPLAVAVHRLLGEQEVVIKRLDPIVGDVPGISGASILGDGRVALIMDVGGLTKEVRQHAAVRRAQGGSPGD